MFVLNALNAPFTHRSAPPLNSSLNVTMADPHSLGMSVVVQVLFRIVGGPLLSRHFGVPCYCCPQVRLLSFGQLCLKLAARLDRGFGSGLGCFGGLGSRIALVP